MAADVLTLIAAVVAMLGSPGPAPLALAAVGASHGARGGAPFLAGILAGIAVVIVLTGAGVLALISAYKPALIVMRAAAFIYILYIALRIWRGAPIGESRGAAPQFRDGFILNLINPKAYAAFAAIFSVFGFEGPTPAAGVALTGIIAFVLVVMIDGAWLLAGTPLQSIAARPKAGAAMRAVFAISVVAAAGLGLFLV